MRLVLPVIFLLATSLEAPAQIRKLSGIPKAAMHPESQAAKFSQTIDRTVAKEHELIELMDNLTPLVETYIQIMRPDQKMGMIPIRDEYFLGRLAPGRYIKVTSYLGEPGVLNRIGKRYRTRFKAQGFTRMIFPDKENFDRLHYQFRYAGGELLGDVPCLRIDVLPKTGSGQGRFLGRIWVGHEDYTIVRFNGVLTNHPKFKNSVHFDSWRLNFFPRIWLPVYVYSEESNSHALRYKAQTRLWAYDLQHAGDHREFEQKLVDAVVAGGHIDPGVELSPVLSERSLQYSKEDDVIERLQLAGLVAPDGEVDRVLESIAKDLVLHSDIDGLHDVRCRVLLTLPLDSFSVGHTIFISRGLLDVLPDEATIAWVLAHELGHIILGHSVIAETTFSNDVLLTNEQVLARLLRFHRDQVAERTADEKALEFLANSQYRQKLDSAAQFLQELNTRSSKLPNLICPHLRNHILAGQDSLMAPQIQSASRADASSDSAALSLGSRIKLNPWSNRIELIQPALVPMLMVRERMPLQLTPFHPYLSRSCLADAAAVSSGRENLCPGAAPSR